MKLWEIVIELGTEYCRQGYGFRSLSMFLDRISELSGRNKFKSRVAPDNTASQRLMEKVEFQIIGLSDCYGLKEDEKSRIEKEYLALIDDSMKLLAERIGVAPEKLLTNVLEYRKSL